MSEATLSTSAPGAAASPRVAVVVPCYRAGERVMQVLARIGPEVGWIFVVDDACPDHTGEQVEAASMDPRVRVLRHAENQGVGGATLTGYRAALASPADVVVKLDGDGQMDPGLIPQLTSPVLAGEADYAKGNRFYNLRDVVRMPWVRLFGNAALSFMTKLSSGYWQLFDPTNGFTAIHRSALEEIDLGRVSRRYFFETDLLYHLNQARAVVVEMPMRAVYDDEPSGLRPGRMVGPFLWGHLRNFFKRVVYSYFVRGFSVASLALLIGLPLLAFGVGFGAYQWSESVATGTTASAGTVMLAALPTLLGAQLLVSWLGHDIAAEPRLPLQRFKPPRPA